MDFWVSVTRAFDKSLSVGFVQLVFPAVVRVMGMKDDGFQPSAFPLEFNTVARHIFNNRVLADGRVKGNFESAVPDNQGFRDRFIQQRGKGILRGYFLPCIREIRRKDYVIHVGQYYVRQPVNDDGGKSGVQLADVHSHCRDCRPEFRPVGVKLTVHFGKLFRAAAIPDAIFNGVAPAVKPFRDVDGVGRCRLDPQKGADAVSYTVNDFHLLFLRSCLCRG